MKPFIRSFSILAGFFLVTLVGHAQEPPDLPSRARDIMKQHCFECHGKNPKFKGNLNLFDRAYLDDKERKILVAKQPDESELFKRVQDGTMPPKSRPRLQAEEVKVLQAWIAAGGEAFAWEDPNKDLALQRAAQVKEIFRTRCLECHSEPKVAGGINIFDHAGLLGKKRLVPGKADESLIYQLVTANDASSMPPPGQPRLSQQQVETVRDWINDGAPAFPADVAVAVLHKKDPGFKGSVEVEYVLQNILRH